MKILTKSWMKTKRKLTKKSPIYIEKTKIAHYDPLYTRLNFDTPKKRVVSL